jgi:hypothetical protein
MKKGKEQEYNAQGSKEMSDAHDETDDFKRGGHAKKKKMRHGGHVEGHKAKERADRKPHKRAMGGRTPFSSGHETSMPKEGGKTDTGHEGQRPEG